FTIAEVAGLMDELVASRHQSFLSVTRQSVRLIHQFIRQPLMMNPRRVDRLLDVHVVIDHVRDYVEDGIEYRWTTRTANRKPKAAIFAQDECGRHRRQGTLARRDRVALALDQAIEIWR